MVKVGDIVVCVNNEGASPGHFTVGRHYEIVEIVNRRCSALIYRCLGDMGVVHGQFAYRWKVLESGPW